MCPGQSRIGGQLRWELSLSRKPQRLHAKGPRVVTSQRVMAQLLWEERCASAPRTGNGTNMRRASQEGSRSRDDLLGP